MATQSTTMCSFDNELTAVIKVGLRVTDVIITKFPRQHSPSDTQSYLFVNYHYISNERFEPLGYTLRVTSIDIRRSRRKVLCL